MFTYGLILRRSAAGVLRDCIWCASGVTNDFFLFFIATFYRVKTLLTMLRIRDPDLGVIQRQEIAAHKHQTHTPISMDFNVIIYDDG